MLAARRVEQQCFGDRIPALVGALEQQAADGSRPFRTARLAGALPRDAGTGQRRNQQIALRRFAGPLSAFDCDEAAARPRVRRNAQCKRLQIRCAAAIATRPTGPMRSTFAPAISGASAGAMSEVVTTTLPTGSPFLIGAGTGLS